MSGGAGVCDAREPAARTLPSSRGKLRHYPRPEPLEADSPPGIGSPIQKEDPVEQIPFDDIERLKTKISDEFGAWSEPLEVTQEMIDQFADLTGDHQWIHVDAERAKRESPFGQTIAHGFLTLSLLPAMKRVPDWLPTGFGNATNYGANKLRFVSPVPAGSKMHSRARLTGVESHKRGTQVTQEIQVNVVGSEKPALIYEMVVLYHPPMG